MKTLYFLDRKGLLSENTNLPIVPKKSEWIRLDNPAKLTRSYPFERYEQVLIFVQMIMKYAQQIQHHPDILITTDQVTVTTFTQYLNDITEQDIRLAKMSDQIYTDVTYVQDEVSDVNNDERLAERYNFDWTTDW